jgi:hypothetical protein
VKGSFRFMLHLLRLLLHLLRLLLLLLHPFLHGPSLPTNKRPSDLLSFQATQPATQQNSSSSLRFSMSSPSLEHAGPFLPLPPAHHGRKPMD